MWPRHVLVALTASALVAGGSCRRAAPEAKSAPPPVAIVQPGAPGQPSRELPAGAPAAPPPAFTGADVAFMQGMIHHHAQAVGMVKLLQTRTARPDLKLLGQRIAVSQTDEIRMMTTWLADRGQAVPTDRGDGMVMLGGRMMAAMPGMLTPAQMASLEKAKGKEFDRLFLEGMIQHHEGALAMVEDLLRSPGAGQESVMFDFITHVDADQRMEIGRMRQLLKDTR